MSLELIIDLIMSGKVTSFAVPIFIGVLTAGAIFCFIGGRYSGFVRALLDARAESAETAKTLAQLGVKSTSALLRGLRDGSSLRKSVEKAIGKNGESLYYIPPAQMNRAASLFVKKRSSLGVILLSVALLIAVLFAVIFLVPSILELAK